MSELTPEIYDQNSERIVYALLAHSDGILAGTGSGLLRSNDQGSTWQDALLALDLEAQVAIISLAEQSNMVFAGAAGAVLLSPDFGESWAMVYMPLPLVTVSALAASPQFLTDSTVFAGTLEGGVFVSHSGGEHWQTWNFGLQDYHVLSLVVSPAFSADQTLYVGTETGLFRSGNGGRSWREVAMPCGLDAIVSLAISPDFATDQTLVAGSENNGLWLSPDGGRSWQRLAEGLLEEPVNNLLFLTGSGTAGLLAVTSSGLWHSQAPFNTWCNLLPDEYAGRELTAACPLLGETEALKIAAGFVDGEIVIIPS